MMALLPSMPPVIVPIPAHSQGFLGPKLSDGKIRQQEHIEIIKYRLQKGINHDLHLRGMKNLGWQEQRYENLLKEHAPATHEMEVKAKQVSLRIWTGHAAVVREISCCA